MLRMFRRLSLKAIVNTLFVRPTSNTVSTNNSNGVAYTPELAYDGDAATYAKLDVKYNGVFVKVRYIFDNVLPIGTKVTLRLAKVSLNNYIYIRSVDEALTNLIEMQMFGTETTFGDTSYVYTVTQATKAIELHAQFFAGMTPSSPSSFYVYDIKAEV